MAVPVRARDVRSNIREYGFENGVVRTLEGLAEEVQAMKHTMREMAEVVGLVVDNVDKFLAIGDSLRVQLEEVKRRDEQHKSIDDNV